MKLSQPFDFIGWIPCLSGELFFSKTIPSLGSFDFFHANVCCRDREGKFLSRHLFATSVVDWQDTNYLSEPNAGLFRVVLVGTSDSYKSLSGSVYLIEKNTLDRPACIAKHFPRRNCEQEKTVVSLIADISQKLELDPALQYGDKERDGCKNFALEIDKELTQRNEGDPFVHKCNFVVHRTGIVVFSPKNAFDKPSGKISCRLSFYYLKFLLHKHSHHADDNESLTTLHDIRETCLENAEILIRDIKRGLVDAKRSRRFSQNIVSGIATYGDSLVKSCHALGWFEPDKKFNVLEMTNSTEGAVQSGYFKNVKSSLEILQRQSKEQASQSIWAKFKQFLLPSATLLGPVVLYMNFRGLSDNNFQNNLTEMTERFDSVPFLGQLFDIVDLAVKQGHLLSFVLLYVAVIVIVPFFIAILFASSRAFSGVLGFAEGAVSRNAGSLGKSNSWRVVGAVNFPIAIVVLNLKRLSNAIRRPSNVLSIVGFLSWFIAWLLVVFSLDFLLKSIISLVP